jgi:hypothetical protein
MPISQERMLNLLTEAENYRDELNWIRERLRGLLAMPHVTFTELNEFRNDVEFALIQQHLPPCSNMAVERYHFKKAERRNNQERMRLSHKRLTARIEGNRAKGAEKKPASPRPSVGVIPPRFSQQELDAMDPVDPTDLLGVGSSVDEMKSLTDGIEPYRPGMSGEPPLPDNPSEES